MSRIYNEVVFDEKVEGTAPVYSDAEWIPKLSCVDSVNLGAVVTQCAGSNTTLAVFLENSMDMVLWREAEDVINPILTQDLSTTSKTVQTFSNSFSPTFFVRLRVELGGSTPRARVKLIASCRIG